ncbi:MAG: proton-conducting transporter membrane subunit [Actinomycetota bacterium]|nr:proton-conducting transporter membrane subunit [Actinomycetota bacterium]
MHTLADLGGLVALAGPLAGAAMAGRDTRTALRRAARGAAVGAVGAVIALAGVAMGGTARSALPHLGGTGLLLDHFTVAVLVLVALVGAVVLSFARRYLQDDPRGAVFARSASIVVAGMVLVTAAGDIVLMTVGWVLAGAAFVVTAGYRTDLPQVAGARRSMLRSFAVGDLALVGAVAVIVWHAGDVNLGNRLAASTRLPGHLGLVVAALVGAAALSRCGQGPFRTWLPKTVAAPTPASALLHAGVVNGGGILLLRLDPVATSSLPVTILLFAVAGGSAVAAGVAAGRRPDAKGGLALSTMAQMGFMLAEVAVGAPVAATTHLIGHGFYKASLFLGSGARVTPPVAGAGAGVRRPGSSLPAAAAAVIASLAAAATSAAVMRWAGMAGGSLVAVIALFVAFAAGAAAWGWWEHRPASRGANALAAVTLLAGSAAYGAVAAGAAAWFGPALPAGGHGALAPGWLVAVAVGGVVLSALERDPRLSRRLAGAGLAGLAPSGRAIERPPLRPARQPSGRLIPGLAGAGAPAGR